MCRYINQAHPTQKHIASFMCTGAGAAGTERQRVPGADANSLEAG